MRKTKHYRKKKTRRTRRNIRRKYSRRGMKGGGVIPFSELGDAFNMIGYNLTKGVDSMVVPPSSVPPNKIGGDNPLPFKQDGPTTNISDYKVN